MLPFLTHTNENRFLLKMMMMMIRGALSSSSASSSSTKIALQHFSAVISRCGGPGADPFPCVPSKTFHLKFLRLDSVHRRILKPIQLRSSSTKVNMGAAEIFEAVEKSPRETVRVSFQLRKECVFGEQFFILGDDPVFGGFWEPENALPLNWSDGHVWTVDLVCIYVGILLLVDPIIRALQKSSVKPNIVEFLA